MQSQLAYAVVASGTTISGTVALAGAALVGLSKPLVNSCNLFLQVSFDTTSANYGRAQHPTSSGDWTWGVNSVPAGVDVSAVVGGFQHVRVEMSNAQSDTRTLTFNLKY